MFLNSYGELVLDDCNRFDFEFPIAKEEYENAVADQISGYEAQQELDFHNYHSA